MSFIKSRIKTLRKKNTVSKSSSREDESPKDNKSKEKSKEKSSSLLSSLVKPKKSDMDFMVRWHHCGPEPLGTFKAGTMVKVVEFIKELNITLKNGTTVRVTNMCKVTAGKGKKAYTGVISTVYLDYVGEVNKVPALSMQVHTAHPVSSSQLEGRWFFGRVSPIECAIWLANRSYLMAGNYLVCQPSFLFPKPGEWPRFLLVVRLSSGCIRVMQKTWYIDEYNNELAQAKVHGFDVRKVENDILPPNDPPANIAYIVIQRTKDGRFFIEKEETSFLLMTELIEHHYSSVINYNGGTVRIFLREYIQPITQSFEGRPVIDRDPATIFRCPPPPPIPAPCDEFSGTDQLANLIQVPNIKLEKTQTRMWKTGLIGANGQEGPSGVARRAVFYLQNRWTPVSFRALNKDMTSLPGLADDLLFLDAKSRATNQQLNEANRLKLRLNGCEYIAQIVTGDITDKRYGAWLAYEFVPGIPLDDLLERRRADNDRITMRPRYEMMAQIAAGMRFLEQNGLCHRHLCCRNVICMIEGLDHFRLKITDYMMPYSFLNKVNAKTVNLNKFAAKTNVFLWWAPEALVDRIFDIKADVWSFGCVIFEILTDGEAPYSFEIPAPVTAITSLIEFLERQEWTMRLTEAEVEEASEPEPFIHQIVRRCFNRDPSKRPTFQSLNKFFCDLLFNSKLDPLKVIADSLSSAAEFPTSEATTY